jgi:TolA-binding protein
MGCSCKKKNQSVSNQTISVQLSEGTSNSSPQEVIIMEQQIDQIIKKVEEISELNNNKE